MMFLSDDLQQLIQTFCKLPGIGPRSARRVVLHLLKNKSSMAALQKTLHNVAQNHQECTVCGYIDTRNPCFFCTSDHRDPAVLCIVADTGDVWAFEKACFFKGRYHILGGLISAFHGKRPEDLNLESLKKRLTGLVTEVILGMDGTLEGQTTLHYMTNSIHNWAPNIRVSSLAKGMPVGGEFDYMDQGTLISAFAGRSHTPLLTNSIQQWR